MVSQGWHRGWKSSWTVSILNRNFAVFILTHGRADNVYTEKSLREQGYTGKIYYIVDDEDKDQDAYIEKWG